MSEYDGLFSGILIGLSIGLLLSSIIVGFYLFPLQAEANAELLCESHGLELVKLERKGGELEKIKCSETSEVVKVSETSEVVKVFEVN